MKVKNISLVVQGLINFILLASGFPLFIDLIFLVSLLVIIEIFQLIWVKFYYIFGLEWFMNIVIKKSLFFDQLEIGVNKKISNY